MHHDITLLLFVTHVDILYLVPTQPPTPLKGYFDPMDEKKLVNSIFLMKLATTWKSWPRKPEKTFPKFQDLRIKSCVRYPFIVLYAHSQRGVIEHTYAMKPTKRFETPPTPKISRSWCYVDQKSHAMHMT